MTLDDVFSMDEPVNPSSDAQEVILYGAGALGRFTAAAMREAGMALPRCFSDSDENKWGTSIYGCSVIAPGRLTERSPLVVVTIFNGASVRRELRARGCNVVSFPQFYRANLLHRGPRGTPLPYGSIDDVAALRKQEPLIRAGYDLWDDDESRQEYVAQIQYRLTLDDACLPPPLPADATYFPDLIPWREHECFVDCGAYDGDSIRAFLQRRSRGHDRIIAIEPDPANADRMVLALQNKCEYRVVNAAVGAQRGVTNFNAAGMAGSIVAKGTLIVDVRTLDEILENETPTRIKMDIEGSELAALVGARRVLETHRPALAVCLYHKPEDLWTIPAWIRSAVPGYRLFLRRYSEDCWELICYAVAP